MKTLILIPILLIVCSSFSQTGAIQIQCINKNDLKPLENIKVEVMNDSMCFESITNKDGLVLLRELPVGENKIWFTDASNGNIQQSQVFIQDKQVLQTAFYIDTAYLKLDQQLSYQGENNKAGQANNQYIDRSLPIRTMNVTTLQEIQCVSVSYRAPLLSRDGGASGAMVTREDIARMPTRSVVDIASTVGGVKKDESTGDLYIRGGRASGITYYVDGMRVQNVNGIPKSAINSTQVITGGIPANYGDVNGGVVVVETKSPGRSPHSIEHRTRTERVVNHNPPAVVQPFKEESPQFSQEAYDQFLPIYENDFLSPMAHPNSTFSIDVDQASWNYLKTKINQGGHVQRDAVKLEEMINSFKYSKVEVPENELMHVKLERVQCDWNPEHELVTVHLKAMDLPKDLPRKTHNLVLLVDVSGSMTAQNKLPLLVKAMKDFVNTLDERDVVSIVTYAGRSGVALEPTQCNDKGKIQEVLNGLVSGGSTNGIGGITMAYELAEKNYNPEYNNRIILCTDGDFNVGISSNGDLENYISTKRGKGIYLTALGFGMGNYKNDKLETLADKGDGNHFYINDLATCRKVLVEDIGNLINIARDVKLNVEFNPNLVEEYRLIGYENRLLKPRDFEDDTKDAGEIGYGHNVTAVYEIVPGKADKDKNHFVKAKDGMNQSELAYVKLRYKAFEDSSSVERRYSLKNSEPKQEQHLLNTVIGFGLYLRNSAFKGKVNEQWIMDHIRFLPKEEEELKNVIKKYLNRRV